MQHQRSHTSVDNLFKSRCKAFFGSLKEHHSKMHALLSKSEFCILEWHMFIWTKMLSFNGITSIKQIKSSSRNVKCMKCIVKALQFSSGGLYFLSSNFPTVIPYPVSTFLVMLLSHLLASIPNLMFYIYFLS